MLTSGRMMDKTIVRPDEMPESKLSSMKNIGVLPDYELSTANIPCSVMNHFGVPAPQPALASILQQAKGAEKVGFFFVNKTSTSQNISYYSAATNRHLTSPFSMGKNSR